MQRPFSVKNIIMFRLSREIDLSKISELAKHCQFSPCAAHEISKTGWVPPVGDEFESLTHEKSGMVLLCARTDKKNIPSDIMKERLDEKVTKLETEQSRKLKRTEIAAIKDEILHELLPVTLPKSTRNFIWVDIQAGMVIVDSNSARRAEEVNALLRKTIGSLPVIPLTMETPVEITLTEWVQNGNPPKGIVLGSDATLISTLEEGGTVTVKNQELTCQEIQNHIESGKRVVKAALVWHDRLSFVLKDDFSVTRLRFSEELTEQNDDIDREDHAQRFDADFNLFTGEIMELINALITGAGGEARDKDNSPESPDDKKTAEESARSGEKFNN